MNELIAVLDIGKTMAKLSLWTHSAELVARDKRVNKRVETEHYRGLDVGGIESWLRETLAGSGSLGHISDIVPVGHGAAAAVLHKGSLAMPPLDYESPIPGEIAQTYRGMRDDFETSGSPCLADGLNLGTQLNWLETLNPDAFDEHTQILLWPQYWAWRLSGVASAEVTSLGCHTDLWQPLTGTFSSLARQRGWADMFPPVARAGDALGPPLPEWRIGGIDERTRIRCGLHDSNAALLAARGFEEIRDREATVLSTGTWFVAMRTPRHALTEIPSGLSQARDCLVNVDAYGKSIPSARFMGGREIELLTGIDTRRVDVTPDQPSLLAAVPEVVEREQMILPTATPGFGPFPDGRLQWLDMPETDPARRAAICLYAAMVANEALDLVGARERILIEGRFVHARIFVRALAALRPRDAILTSHADHDVSFGALRLLDPALSAENRLTGVEPLDIDIARYHAKWLRNALLPRVPA